MAKKNKSKKKNKKKLGFRFFISAFILVIVSLLFWSSSLLIFFGMIPSLVAWAIDKSVQKSKTITIAAMNFAGCFPYLVDVWTAINPMALSIRYLTDPVTIIVIYSAALVGYIINYFCVIIISSLVSEKAKKRLEIIEKEKKEMEVRWGKKVNGEITLDSRGFPIESLNQNLDEENDLTS